MWLSGRAKYTSSKTQRLTGLAGSGASFSTFPSMIRTNSPGISSHDTDAPTRSKTQLSEATIMPCPSLPMSSGRKPRGSTVA